MSACEECGAGFKRVRTTKVFCSSACRLTFNQRRRERGAELYDALMSNAGSAAVDKLLDAYRQADKTKRQGRRSWQPWRRAVLNMPMAYGSSGDNR